VDYRIIVSEGELLWVRHWTLERGRAANGGPPRFLILIMPIPEQKHLEWECLRVSERECNRIGQELHDDLCQVLAGLTFMMRVVGQRARSIDATLAAEIEEFNAHLVGATDRVRSMAHGLFPAQLKYSTLRHALTAFAAEARTLFTVEIALSIPRKIPRHTPEMIVHVYRIAQEAVSNAVRHGRATRVSVVLSTNRTGVVMRIRDDGTGLPDEAQRPEGIGMHVMQYRARVLGGALSIENTPPRGVAVCLSYPVSQPAPVTNTQPHKIS
jgi:two-component system CheB/CheR fusion protein